MGEILGQLAVEMVVFAVIFLAVVIFATYRAKKNTGTCEFAPVGEEIENGHLYEWLAEHKRLCKILANESIATLTQRQLLTDLGEQNFDEKFVKSEQISHTQIADENFCKICTQNLKPELALAFYKIVGIEDVCVFVCQRDELEQLQDMADEIGEIIEVCD